MEEFIIDEDTITLLNIKTDSLIFVESLMVSKIEEQFSKLINDSLSTNQIVLKDMCQKFPKLYQTCKQMLHTILKHWKVNKDLFCEPVGRHKLRALHIHQHDDYVKFLESELFQNLSHTIVHDLCAKLLKKEDIEQKKGEISDEFYKYVYAETKILFLMCEPTIKGRNYFNKTMSNIIQNNKQFEKRQLTKKSAEEKNKLMKKKEKDDGKKKKLEDPKRICYKDSAGIMHYSTKK